MAVVETASVTRRVELGRSHVRLRLRAERIARESLPGQFVNVRCTPLAFSRKVFEDWDTFLRQRRAGGTGATRTLLMRPFAVYRRWKEGPEKGQFEVLFKVVGRGTAALAQKQPGEEVEVLGPLGKGFDLDWCRRLSTAVVVAGGVGLAPLYPLVEFLRSRDVHTIVIVGVISEHDVPIEVADSRVTLSFVATRPDLTITAKEFERLGCEVGVVALEGEKGYTGLPTEVFDRFLHWSDGGARGEAGVFTCGPWAMMREVARHAAEHDVRCEVLLEERMGCGVGACMACACRIRAANGEVVRKRICVDGPVFDGSEVVWDEG